ncbi:flavin reductase family protein [Nocardia wallacei]|uniref:flavin reductase family protein n=1 Tax=Nocardia wallacei TaxID=480035 RepID=UPI0024566875|nr:flavin reductase family protein [Nocardia wallacei]
MSDKVNPSRFRHVLSQYPTGVVVIGAVIPGEQPAALTIGSFSSVSLDPPLIAFYPDKSSASWPKIRQQQRFSVNVLSAQQEDVCRRFARKGSDKFAGVPWRPAPSGAPIIDGAAAWLDCELYDVQEAGDHYLVFGRVVAMDADSNQSPLLFFRGGYGCFTATNGGAA